MSDPAAPKNMRTLALTDEQKAVIEALHNKKTIRVNAFAGSGKTTTLLETIKAHPSKQFLYLVFNRRNKEEAQEKLKKAGVKNASVYTIHGYAFGKTRAFHRFQVKPNKPSTPAIMKITHAKTLAEAAAIWDVFYTWMIGDCPKFSKDVIAQIADEKGIRQDLFHQASALKTYMEKDHITHDLYLKYFQINFEALDQSAYDVVLLDEAQDSNPITLWLFDKIQAKQKVLVGDVHQQIYTFRGSVNAMQSVEADITLPLTASFRFGPDIASTANHILHLLKSEAQTIRGMKTEFTNQTQAYLSRTNGRLIQVMDELGDANWKTIRQPEEIFAAPLTILAIVHPFYKNQVQSLIGERMHAYAYLESTLNLHTIRDILEYAEETGDSEIFMAGKIVERYDTRLLDLFELAKKKENNKDAHIILATAHTAKGLEWDTVHVENDFPDLPNIMGKCDGIDSLEDWHALMQRAEHNPSVLNRDMLNVIQEINLLYVAATRATNTLSFPYEFDPEWVDMGIRASAKTRKAMQKGTHSASNEDCDPASTKKRLNGVNSL